MLLYLLEEVWHGCSGIAHSSDVWGGINVLVGAMMFGQFSVH